MEGWRPGRDLAEWEQTRGKKKAKCALTSTGLLMEGPKVILLLLFLRCFRSCFLFWRLGGRADLWPQFKEYYSSACLFRIFKIVPF
jgi:hypothetical protein